MIKSKIKDSNTQTDQQFSIEELGVISESVKQATNYSDTKLNELVSCKI